MLNDVTVFINGKLFRVQGSDCFLTLANYLRNQLRLVGTKIMCSEGDCGACTVLVGREINSRIVYRSVDSCIQFMFQLEGTHVVTIEGMSRKNAISGKSKLESDSSIANDCKDAHLCSIQKAMVDNHSSQCGYCTPGFVMALAGLREDHACVAIDEAKEALSGNLCRCTGYTAILDAVKDERFSRQSTLSNDYPDLPILQLSRERSRFDIEIPTGSQASSQNVFIPASLASALQYYAENPTATIIAGASDVGVWHCKSGFTPEKVLCLNRIAELKLIDGLAIGAAANWDDIRRSFQEFISPLDEILSIFGSPQIRHVGTIGGNIANGSPIADSLPFLFAVDAVLELVSVKGRRNVPIREFYTGYKKNVLTPGELIFRIHLPYQWNSKHLRLYKVSRRKDMDISTFTAAIVVEMAGGVITAATVAMGGVGPTVLMLQQVQDWLIGKPFDLETFANAGEIAADVIVPISDVRGSSQYRRLLAKNIFLKYFHQLYQDTIRASISTAS